MYDYPDHSGATRPPAWKLTQARHDQMMWLFSELDVLMPVLYLKGAGPGGHAVRAKFVRDVLTETERLLAAAVPSRTARHLPAQSIVPFVWERSPGLLQGEDLQSEFVAPWRFGHVEALLKWGDPVIGHQSVTELQNYWDTTLTPLLNKTLDELCACAKSSCSGHGRCYQPPPPPSPTPPSPPRPPGPPGPPHPHPPAPGVCLALMKHLTGPSAAAPDCRSLTNKTKCLHCFKPHLDALMRSGCNASSEHKYCQNTTNPSGDGTTLTPSPLCHCDSGFSGVDCSKSTSDASSPVAPSAHAHVVTPASTNPDGGVVCPDGISACPKDMTCAQFVTGMWGCCPLPNATICPTQLGAQCCPSGQQCHSVNKVATCYVFSPPAAPPTRLKADDFEAVLW